MLIIMRLFFQNVNLPNLQKKDRSILQLLPFSFQLLFKTKHESGCKNSVESETDSRQINRLRVSNFVALHDIVQYIYI